MSFLMLPLDGAKDKKPPSATQRIQRKDPDHLFLYVFIVTE